jgi:Ras association domain-containing protein 9/10
VKFADNERSEKIQFNFIVFYRKMQHPEPLLQKRVIISNDQLNSNDNEMTYSSDSSSSSHLLEIWSQEIPVWIKEEQRWISGITDQTTCFNLIEALLVDEGIIETNCETELSKIDGYVITERWRQVEQILDGKTKILNIWMAWGAEQSEVIIKNFILLCGTYLD